MKKIKFDEALEKLEEITRTLEQGDLGLEDSVKVYEEGMKLALTCQKILLETENKIGVLSEKINGDFVVQPIQIEEKNVPID